MSLNHTISSNFASDNTQKYEPNIGWVRLERVPKYIIDILDLSFHSVNWLDLSFFFKLIWLKKKKFCENSILKSWSPYICHRVREIVVGIPQSGHLVHQTSRVRGTVFQVPQNSRPSAILLNVTISLYHLVILPEKCPNPESQRYWDWWLPRCPNSTHQRASLPPKMVEVVKLVTFWQQMLPLWSTQEMGIGIWDLVLGKWDNYRRYPVGSWWKRLESNFQFFFL